MARLRILEFQFFLNDDNMVDGATRPTPDPAVKTKVLESIAEGRKLAAARLAFQALGKVTPR